MTEVISTWLEDFRARETDLSGESHYELKDKDGKPFDPNLFADIEKDGLKIWSEDGGSVIITDDALIPLKVRLVYLTGKAI